MTRQLLRFTIALLIAIAAVVALPNSVLAATYNLTFNSTWSAATHPTDFPDDPHYSGLIGATHAADVTFWAEGELASLGVQSVAETGSKNPLDREIEALVAEEAACELISGDGISVSPGSVSVEFTATQECPSVSVIAMIAPSPDWIVGVSGLELYQGGYWQDSAIVVAYPYDAGTDLGTTYTAPDRPADPHQPIAAIATAPFTIDSEVVPLGAFLFTRLEG